MVGNNPNSNCLLSTFALPCTTTLAHMVSGRGFSHSSAGLFDPSSNRESGSIRNFQLVGRQGVITNLHSMATKTLESDVVGTLNHNAKMCSVPASFFLLCAVMYGLSRGWNEEE